MRSRLLFFIGAIGIILTSIFCYIINVHLFCSWASRGSTKILFLADPQIEGADRARRELTGELSNNINDIYQKYVVSSLVGRFRPDLVVLLGDIFSRQYLTKEEHAKRHKRFLWIFNSVFSSGIPLINVTGNHDIGYGAEITKELIDQFENSFGPVNSYHIVNGHVLLNLNSLNLDARELRKQTKDFMSSFETSELPILLATHIPLHKSPSPCVDQPLILRNNVGHVTQQNFLSPKSTQDILGKLAPVAIFTGHDHEGCFYEHPGGIPEFTVRSMMGDFSGNAGFFEILGKKGDYAYHYSDCSFVRIQYITVLFAAMGIWAASLFLTFCCFSGGQRTHQD